MIRARFARLAARLALTAALGAAACGDSTTTSPSSTSSSTASTELFTGTLSPGGAAFYSFTVTTAGDVSITLASLSSGRIGPALTSRLSVGIGVPSGFGCTTTAAVDSAPGLTAQLAAAGASDNIYCVNVSDPGVLSGDVTFVVRIVHT